LGKKVLVDSRSSEFKDAVVKKIGEAFKDEPIYVKFIGLEQLKAEAVPDRRRRSQGLLLPRKVKGLNS